MTDAAQALSDANGSVRVNYFRGDGEKLPEGLPAFDVVVSAYVHHHMNLSGRKKLAEQMEAVAKDGAFIGVVDFYTPDFEDYYAWYKAHFDAHNDAPPVENPLIPAAVTADFYESVNWTYEDDQLENSYLLTGLKQ